MASRLNRQASVRVECHPIYGPVVRWAHVCVMLVIGISPSLLQAAHFEVYGTTAPLMTGELTTVTVEAWEGTNILQNYTGTVQFASVDALATLPSPYVFTTNDMGVRVFSNQVAFVEAGTHLDVEVEDSTNAGMNGVHAGFGVFNGYASEHEGFAIWGIRTPCFTSEWQDVSIAAVDRQFNLYTNYHGTVDLSSSDGAALYGGSVGEPADL